MKYKDKGILVSVRCAVYNHEPYLRDCLNGFVMQKTNFRFEAIIHDDASTDMSAIIIREYAEKFPEVIKPIYQKENLYSKCEGDVRKAINAAINPDSKYIALCEGDDYWIDPLKLQKQVDYLETHPDYSYVWSNAYIQKGLKILKAYNRYECDCNPNISDIIMKGGLWVPTASILIRKEVYFTMPIDCRFNAGDYVLQIWGAYKGKNHYFSQPMCVYRVNSIGSWTSRIKKQSMIQQKERIDNEHYTLQKMDEYTNKEFHLFFEQRWHEYAFNIFKDMGEYKKAMLHLEKILPEYKQGIICKCYSLGLFRIGKFLHELREYIKK